MKILLPLAAAALLTGCVTGPPSPAAQARMDKEDAKLTKALEGKVAGKPVSCINLRDIKSTQYIGERTILYTMNNRLTYRNDPYGGCSGLDQSRTLVTRTTTGQLCRGDIATVADLVAGFQVGSCAMGEFVPYKGR